jgi:hypothetical protein
MKGKAGQDIVPFLKGLRSMASKLGVIAADLGTAFISTVEKHLSDVAVVFDRYHVSALMNKGIELTR